MRLRFLQLTRHPDEIDYWLRRGELPSTRAMPLRRKSLSSIAAALDYFVCEKTDGVRYCLVASCEGRLALLDRAMEVREHPADPALAAFLARRPGDTVLDGELVADLATGQDMFVIFDALVVDGERTGLWHSFKRRLAAAESWLSEAMEDAAFPFDVIIKCQTPCQSLDEVNSRFTSNLAGHGWVYSDGNCTHVSDGLIFTPATVSYYVCMPYKWKPAELMTVDFSVSMSDLARRQGTVSGAVKMQDSDVTVCEVHVDRSEAWVRELLTGHRGARSVVLECLFQPEEGLWRALKHRGDKNVPNSVRTAFSTLEAIAEGLTLSYLVDHFRGARPSTEMPWETPAADSPDKISSYTNLSSNQLVGRGGRIQADQSYIKETITRNESKPSGSSVDLADKGKDKAPKTVDHETDVGGHYDRIQRERAQGGLDERIAMLRKLQNWNKACMIKKLRDLKFDSDLDLEGMLLGLRVTVDKSAVDPLMAPPPRHSPPNKSSRIPMKVLDLACGRGGDINKWTRDGFIVFYAGVDISGEELVEARKRASGYEPKSESPIYHFLHGSCDSPSLLRELYECVNSRNPSALNPRSHKEKELCGLNVVWCQFALHYFCVSREALHSLLKNVSGALDRGGRFCASFPNPFAVGRSFAHMRQSGEKKSGSSVCYISVDEVSEISEDQLLHEFGIKYYFTLGDAVQNCMEFVVPLRSLVALAEKLNLKLRRLMQMHTFMSKCAHDEELASLREVMQIVGPKSPGRPLSPEEWDAIGIYCVAVFEKV